MEIEIIISIHAPREGSDMAFSFIRLRLDEFLSTLPARGATLSTVAKTGQKNISIHAPREGSDLGHKDLDAVVLLISIHAPREGSDALAADKTIHTAISIHAPREGSDTRASRGP